MARPRPLKPAALRRRCNRSRLKFKTTDQLAALDEVIGQPRAVEALDFGIGIRRPGFNMFAFGPADTGLRDVVRRTIEAEAAHEAVPEDWVYVFNFEDPGKPRAISLPSGRGNELRADMDGLIDDLRSAIRAAFETDEYRARTQAIEDEVKEQHQQALQEIEKRARENSIALVRTPLGMGFAPVRGEEVIEPEVFNKLPAEERERITRTIGQLQEQLQAALQQLPRLLHQAREKVRALNREVTEFAVGHLIDALRVKYADIAEVVEHLNGLQRDVIENAALFRAGGDGAVPVMPPQAQAQGQAQAQMQPPVTSSLRRYRVNLLVDHSASRGAPIVEEADPSYQNLIGRIEHMAEFGTLVTDFSLIRSGALHRANGGYLVLDARKLLTRPYAWEGLKEALRAGQVRIESLGQIFSLISTVSLEPERIPISLKVVLLGEPMLYYLLQYYDPEFGELFKVAVDFDNRMPRDDDTTLLYARMIGTEARKAGLKALDRDATALVIEESARLAGDGERLSTLTRRVTDMMSEADHWATRRGAPAIGAEDVRAAIDARRHRLDRLAERIREEIARGTILVETDGAAIGQINGLAVSELGDFAFARPSRITARVRMGRGEVIDIEREVKLGGATHSKGVLILSNFLAARYSADYPLSLSASLVFEQSYGGIDGDSASSAELYALLSALADAPLDQGLAVTGSVNQHGEVQAIGGVNEKIEGFYDLCRARGLNGRQGVLIPQSNVKHLMLREDVVAACGDGRFHVFPVATIDEGIEILTGLAAGRLGRDGSYPKDSINRRVVDRLRAYADKRRAFGIPERGRNDGER
jgi:lon-related putative ATP-dependent protease